MPPLPPPRSVSLADGPDAALDQLPKGAGVVQLLAGDGSLLLTGMAANVRRWAADRLGRGRKPRPGKRPPLDLSPVASVVRFHETGSSFAQRLVYERSMAHVPLEQRKDLKAPGWLHLDVGERFPRVGVARDLRGRSALYGPFRNARAAEQAREDVQRLFQIRPCDYDFEPAPDLELGLRCLFAQVETCAAPCLQRSSEPEYLALARRVAEALDEPASRPSELGWPAYVGARAGYRAVIAERGRDGLELYPLVGGNVVEARARAIDPASLESAVGAMLEDDAPPDPEAPDDWPWILAWLAPARRKGRLVRARLGTPAAALAETLRDALPGP